MKNVKTTVTVIMGLFLAIILSATTAKAQSKKEIDSLRKIVKGLAVANKLIEQHLATFDTLDYTVFSGQEWARLHESHAKNVKVYWPDGHMTQGIDIHIEDLKKLFVYAPDTRIKIHPIRFGSGNFTAVTGVFEGTFTKPMPIGNGKFIQPTGKEFKMPMATISIWGADGIMTEEHLFWDNKTYIDQIGLGSN
ncbi:MAG: ester cyclase [Sphingobacteriales bacterium]|nr:ester cyclase [Sphingobacteriales bacterium]